ncbi:hypothetical protein OF376_01505 [Ureaplasma miroungigenitalium]|uniref:Lipoprotein n=1 Tax=Ureaplasma miroungigenitalium TaxID=1042321 RepID=A0ABT3BN36_9BACT|nr:hypothetical protein [Ureaplasma miroungigenitalium]MCV3728442.1 hypothetical protein [Ureaplasma miroungigenitalium]MCV3734229.1 hypothetical protein [Ureaplasma miroungigenitalium]
MKKTIKRKILWASLAGLFVLSTAMIASACSSTAKPGVSEAFLNYNASTNNNEFGKVAMKVNIDQKNPRNKSIHEFVFGKQNSVLKDEYFAIGDLNYTYTKDNKRYDAKNNEIDADGFLLQNDAAGIMNKQSVWNKKDFDQAGYLKPFNMDMIRSELVRQVYNKLEYPQKTDDNALEPTTFLPNNLVINNNFNQALFSSNLLEINNLANLYNHLLVTDSVYTHLTSFTDLLIKYLNQDTGTKIFNFYNKTNNPVAKEFLVGLAGGVGEGKYTYKLALYNIDFDYEIVPNNPQSDLKNVSDFAFGTKVPTHYLVNPEDNNVLVKITNIKLQYAWYDSSSKVGGSFMLPDQEFNETEQLERINDRLSAANKRIFPSQKVEHLVYDLPISDIVMNFRPSVLSSNVLDEQATNQQIQKWSTLLERELTDDEKKVAQVYEQYYAGSLVKVDAFNVLGYNLKKSLEAKNEKTKADDEKFNDLAYYPHDRGLDAVYPYAFYPQAQTFVTRDDFVRSALFNEYAKNSMESRHLYGEDGIHHDMQLAAYSLSHKNVPEGLEFNETLTNELYTEFTSYVKLNDMQSPTDLKDYRVEWNLESRLLKNN